MRSLMLFAAFCGTLCVAHAADVDPTFGASGVSVVEIGGASHSGRNSALQQDGKILVVGSTPVSVDTSLLVATRDMLVARFNANGTPDLTFGNAGVQLIDFAGADDRAHDIAVQADGRIVVVGRTEERPGDFSFAVARLQPNGSPDTTFDGDGRVAIDFGDTGDAAWSVVIQTDGRIVVGGVKGRRTIQPPETSYAGDFAVARLLANGSRDDSFGTNGRTVTVSSTDDTLARLALLRNGKVLAVGGDRLPNGVQSYTAVRFESNGQIDLGFGNGGRVNLSPPPNSNLFSYIPLGGFAVSAVERPDGRILIGGYDFFLALSPIGDVQYEPALFSITENGMLDTTFGQSGFADTRAIGAGLGGLASDIELEPSGKILTSGVVRIAPGASGRYIGYGARFTSFGVLDVTFDGTGVVHIDPSTATQPYAIGAASTTLLRLPDGRIIVSATRGIGEAVTTLEATGSRLVVSRFISDPTVSMAEATAVVNESQSSIVLNVTRRSAAGTADLSTVAYSARSGTASAGTDFVATSGTVSWGPSDFSTKTITIPLTPDSVDEPDETFTVVLTDPSEGSVDPIAVTTITIVDDDVAGTAPPPSGNPGTGGGGGSVSLALLLALFATLAQRMTSSPAPLFRVPPVLIARGTTNALSVRAGSRRYRRSSSWWNLDGRY